MADTTIDSALDAIASASARRFVVSTSKDVVYHFALDGTTKNFAYWKTTSASSAPSTSAAVNVYTTNDVAVFGLWFDKWTPGDTGTKVYTAVIHGGDQMTFRALQTSDDSLATAVNVAGPLVDSAGLTNVLQSHIEVTKAKGGYIFVYVNSNTTTESDHLFRSTNGGTSFTSVTAPTSLADDDLIMLFPSDETDQNDIFALRWDKSANAILGEKYDDSADSWSQTTLISSKTMNVGAGRGFWPWSAVQRHSDGKIILALRPDAPTVSGAIEIWEITPTGTPSATQLTSVITATDEMGSPDLWINQNTDDIRCAYLKAATAIETDGLPYFKESTDGASTWGSEQSYGETADDIKSLSSAGMIVSGDDGIYTLTWVNDDLNDLVTNWVNADVITTGGGGTTTRRYSLSLTGVG